MLAVPIPMTLAGATLMTRPQAVPPADPDHLTLETGDALLLEDGGLILLETE